VNSTPVTPIALKLSSAWNTFSVGIFSEMSLFAKQQKEQVRLQAFVSEICAITGEGGLPS
jgi:hypothetical protein